MAKVKQNKAVALVYRPATQSAVKLAKQLSHWLNSQGYAVYTGAGQKQLAKTKLARSSDIDKFSLVLALGGDGTYLRAVRMLAGRSIPILGVNLGSLGFLTPTRADEALSALQKTISGEMRAVPRGMLQVSLRRKTKKLFEGLALNDVVIERGSLSQLIDISIHSDRQRIFDLRADGLIVSSPTGSTAYNLAAGGPIIHPDAKVFSITAVAPHSLSSRPLILPDDRKLILKLVGKLQKAHFVVDGQLVSNLQAGDEVIIKRSRFDHVMVRDPELGYFDLLREKLKFGDRCLPSKEG